MKIEIRKLEDLLREIRKLDNKQFKELGKEANKMYELLNEEEPTNMAECYRVAFINLYSRHK